MNYSWLKHIEVNIWKACNNKCIFCLSWDSLYKWWDIAFVDYKTIKDKLDWYYSKWYRSIGFLWWDISIHPDLYKIIKYCKYLWYKEIHVITNSMVFDDYNKAKKLILGWVTRVNISVHSHIGDIEDNLIQVPWWLNRKLKAIDNFNILFNKWLLKSSLSINIVLNKQNYKTIVETVLFYKYKKNINDIRINFVWLVKDLIKIWWKIKLSYTEFMPYLKRLIFISEKYNIRITFDSIPACIFYKLDNKKYKYYLDKYLWNQFDHISDIDELSNSYLENKL
jgi:MoaA/NifB/PqqE/SkfB family radical SAM enzyme